MITRCARPALLAALAAALGASVGCGPPIEDRLPQADNCTGDGPADGALTLILGRSDDRENFSPLMPDDLLLRHYGPQGGTHIYVSLKLYDPEPGVWQHHFRLVDTEGNPAGGGQTAIKACFGGFTLTHNITVFLKEIDSVSAATLKVDSVRGDLQILSEMPIRIGE